MEPTNDPKPMYEALGITESRARELIEDLRPFWDDYLLGKIANGEILHAIINQDGLSVTEKVFLSSHMTAIWVKQEERAKFIGRIIGE